MTKVDREKSPSRFERLERAVFPAWVFEPGKEEDRRLTQIGYSTVCIAVIVLTVYALLAYGQHYRVLSLMVLGVAVVLSGIILYHRQTEGTHGFTVEIGVSTFGLFCIYLSFFSQTQGTGFVWSYTFPLIAMSMLGSRRGAIATGLVLLAATAFLVFEPFESYVVIYPVSSKLRFIPSLLVVSILSYLYERNRERTQQRLNTVLTDLSQSKEAVEREVQHRTIQLNRTNEELLREIQERRQADQNLRAAYEQLAAADEQLQEQYRSLTESERAFRESEEKYRILVENATEAVFVAQEGRMAFVNPMTIQMTGYSGAELTSKPFTEFIHPDDRAMVLDRHIRRVRGENPPQPYAFRLVHQDGSISWMEVSSVRISWEGKAASLSFMMDITARRRAEEALQASEMKYRLIFESVTEVIFSLDHDLILTSVSPSVEAILGYRPDQLIGRPIQDLNVLPPEYLEKALLDITRVLGGEQIVSAEYEFVAKDGTTRITEVSGSPLFHDQKIVGLISVSRDVTDRKRSEENLRRSEERFRRIFEEGPFGIVMTSPDFRFVAVNPEFCRMTGYTEAELAALTFADITHPEHVAQDVEKVQSLDRGDIAGYKTEKRYLKKNGKIMWGSLVASAIRSDEGELLYHLAMIQDITDRKRAEEALTESRQRLSDIIEFLPDATLVIDRDGKVIAWNRAMEAMTGVKAEEMLGKGDYEYALPFYGERRPMLIDLAFRPDPAQEEKYTSIHRSGDIIFGESYTPNLPAGEFHMSGTASVLRDSRGETIAAIECIRNNTERKKLEAQLQQAQKMEAIGTLAGGIAHDFNNLLMAIQGNSSLILMNTVPSDPRYEKLKAIEAQVVAGADLTKQLLGFARIGKYEMKPIDLNEVVEKSSVMFGRTKKEILIHKKYEPALWAVEADATQMEQVLLNLYVNAWQAMPGGGHVYLETANMVLTQDDVKSAYLQPGRYVKISVTDTGVGMDEKTRERIFEPFFTTKEMGRGTGLGLAMVYGIVKGHHGQINVYSEKGKGTTFNIYLPASEKGALKGEKVEAVVVKGHETILLVDDEEAVLGVMKEILEALGYLVLSAVNGREALKIYEENRGKIDLVILDLIMPEIGGGEVFDRLKEINPGVKVLLSSGYSLNGEATGIMARGCRGFIQKPVRVAELSQKVRNVLGESVNVLK